MLDKIFFQLSPQPQDQERPSGGQNRSAGGPGPGSHHSLDTDEWLAEQNRARETISPDPDAQEGVEESGPIQPGSVVSGGAAGQSPKTGKGTTPAKPVEPTEPQPTKHVPKTWGKP